MVKLKIGERPNNGKRKTLFSILCEPTSLHHLLHVIALNKLIYTFTSSCYIFAAKSKKRHR